MVFSLILDHMFLFVKKWRKINAPNHSTCSFRDFQWKFAWVANHHPPHQGRLRVCFLQKLEILICCRCIFLHEEVFLFIIAWSFLKKTYLYNFEDNYVTIDARMFVCLTKYYSQSWWCLCMFVTTLVLVLLYLINQNILLCNLWLKCLTEDFVGYLWNLQCISCL